MFTKKTYTGGQPDYVTVVDLRYGSVENLQGTVTGAPNGSISRKSFSAFWTDATGKNNLYKMARVVVNGTLFSSEPNPTPIAFGLKSHGSVLNYGYGLNEYPNLVKTIAFDSSGAKAATIQLWNAATFNGSTPDVVGILDVTANKNKTSYIGRTFIGVSDQNKDGTPETILIYSCLKATQASAASVLASFGASAQGMLDGGSSTGLIISGANPPTINPSRTTIPHAIAFYSGKG